MQSKVLRAPKLYGKLYTPDSTLEDTIEEQSLKGRYLIIKRHYNMKWYNIMGLVLCGIAGGIAGGIYGLEAVVFIVITQIGMSFLLQR